MAFDPLHRWLGIPPHEQPPDHYRLLGISRFESDPDVIDAAANRQMSYVQGFANGEHAKLSQALLNQLAAARIGLLNPKSKRTYDAQLGRSKPFGPEPERTDGPPRGRPKPPELEATPQPPPVKVRGEPPQALRRVASSEPIAADDFELSEDLDLDETHPGSRRGWIVGGVSVLAILAVGLMFRLGTSGDRSKANLAPIPRRPVLPALPVVNGPAVAPAVGPSVPDPDTTAVNSVWDPPAIGIDPEHLFNSLFQGRTIEGPLSDMSNCWLDDTFGNFVLRFEYRLCRHESSPWDGVRLRHGSGHRLSLILTEGLSGGLLLEAPTGEIPPPLVVEALDSTHRIVKPIRSNERPLGHWTRCEVICQGTRTTVAINGEAVNDISSGPNGSGMICLAGFEKGLAFRDLRILSRDDPSSKVVLKSTPSERPSEPNHGNSLPKASVIDGVIQVRTNNYSGSPSDYAELAGRVARVGMGNKQDFGFGEVGLETNGLKSVKIGVRKIGTFKKIDDNSIAGFMVDYHTPGGYTKRVAYCLDKSFTKRWSTGPNWGANRKPDFYFTLQGKSQYVINFAGRAPQDWDGRVWFTILLQNSGRDTSLEVEILEAK